MRNFTAIRWQGVEIFIEFAIFMDPMIKSLNAKIHFVKSEVGT